MVNFYVGQKVVCVSFLDVSAGHGSETLPVVGGVYTIRGFYEHPVGLGLWLEEIVNVPMDYGTGYFECCFNPIRFKPVRTTDISIFTKMLASTPKEREPAC